MSFLDNFPISTSSTTTTIIGFNEDYSPIYAQEIMFYTGKNTSLDLPEEQIASVSKYKSTLKIGSYYVANLEGYYDYIKSTSFISKKDIDKEEVGDYYTVSCRIDLYGCNDNKDTIELPSFRVNESYDDLDTLKIVIEEAGKRVHEQVKLWKDCHSLEVEKARQRWFNKLN